MPKQISDPNFRPYNAKDIHKVGGEKRPTIILLKGYLSSQNKEIIDFHTHLLQKGLNLHESGTNMNTHQATNHNTP